MILSESTTDHAALRAPLKILVAEDSAATLPYCIITGSAIEKDQWVNELGLSPHCFILKPLTQAKLGGVPAGLQFAAPPRRLHSAKFLVDKS